MEFYSKSKNDINSKNKILVKIISIFLIVVLVVFCIFKIRAKIGFNNTSNQIPASETSTLSTTTSILDKNGILELNKTKENGRVWFSSWENESPKTILSGNRDSDNPEFIIRGDGKGILDNQGFFHLQGDTPRMYVYDPSKNKKWSDVEITVYAKRESELETVSSQGIVIGARSNHQDVTPQNLCAGTTYYGRLLYDGRAVFQKELVHEELYLPNKPSENNKVTWNTPDGTMPLNTWIGVKFVVKNNPDGKSVKLELYRDLTDGLNGGNWEKVAEYVDNGSWAQPSSTINVEQKCGFPDTKILIDPATSVFIRNDEVSDVLYKKFSIREIE